MTDTTPIDLPPGLSIRTRSDGIHILRVRDPRTDAVAQRPLDDDTARELARALITRANADYD